MSTMVERIILVSDMDAFFASVEQQVNPRLRGRPIAVIGSGRRTVVTTASYEARRFGVRTGMTIGEARRACPPIILIIGNSEKYTHTCRELGEIYKRFTPTIEIYSVDEAFLDITATHGLFGGPEAIAQSIKGAVQRRFGITCTIGMGPNILLAKLACDLGKPDGIRWIRGEEVPGILENLPVSMLWGIGSRGEAKLGLLGIRTCGELGRAPASLLRERFGLTGEFLSEMGRGICSRTLISHGEDPKSIGQSMTLPHDIGEQSQIRSLLLKLSDMVCRRARENDFVGRIVRVVVRYSDFETFSMQTTMSGYTNDPRVISGKASELIDGVRLREKVRLLGISLSDLLRDPQQMSLFDAERKRQLVLRAMDSVNSRHGDLTLTWANHIMRERDPGVISPAWRP